MSETGAGTVGAVGMVAALRGLGAGEAGEEPAEADGAVEGAEVTAGFDDDAPAVEEGAPAETAAGLVLEHPAARARQARTAAAVETARAVLKAGGLP